jgi:hypothetical protein
MDNENLLLLWSEQAALSVLVWAALGILVLYLARGPAHRLINVVAQGLGRASRLAARLLLRAARRAEARNDAVLLAVAAENEGRYIEREFGRIARGVERDFGDYPALHALIAEQIETLQRDYERSAETPPMPPAWAESLEAASHIESQADASTRQLLQGMREAIERAGREAVDEYRGSSRKRHYWLHRMRPQWRTVRKLLGRVDDGLREVLTRAKALDRHMAQFEKVRRGDDPVVRALRASTLGRFSVAAMGVAVMGFAVALHFTLLGGTLNAALGSDRMLIGGLALGPAATAALVFVCVWAGIMFMEGLRVTRLFAGIAELDDVRRGALMAASLGLLFVLALAQAALAWVVQSAALPAAPAEVAGGRAGLYAVLLLSLLLPFAYLTAGIALEALLQTGRILLGRMVVALLSAASGVLRVVDRLLRDAALMLRRAYDLLVFLPLVLERVLRRGRRAGRGARRAEQGEATGARTS